MQTGKRKKADTLRERLFFQVVLLTFGGFSVWLNAAALFAGENGQALPETAEAGAAYLGRDTPLCTSTNRNATCVTISAGSPVDVFERSGAHSYVRAGSFSGFVRTSAIKRGK